MSYSIGSVAKAVFAGFAAFASGATLAAHGADLSVLTPGDWLGVIGATLVAAGGTFAVPNKSTSPDLSPAETVASVVTQAAAAKESAVSEYNKVISVVSDVAGSSPIFGAEAQAVISAVAPKL